jgi:hypothetical protein
LLAHEAAFALGQMQDAQAIPALVSVLKDLSLHPIVRHEVVTEFSKLHSAYGDWVSMLSNCICLLIRLLKLLELLAWKRAFPCWRKV